MLNDTSLDMAGSTTNGVALHAHMVGTIVTLFLIFSSAHVVAQRTWVVSLNPRNSR